MNLVFLAILLAQGAGERVINGVVVDAQGKGVGGARIVFGGSAVAPDRNAVIAVQGSSDADGNFRLTIPRIGMALAREVNLLAYRPGLAVGAVGIARPPHRIVLRAAKPRTVKIRTAAGAAVAGARIRPRMIHVFAGTLADVPGPLADQLAATTGPDGSATIDFLPERAQLVAVQLTAALIGTQDFLLVEQPGRGSEPAVITIELSGTGKIAGRIIDQNGKGASGRLIEIWRKGGAEWAPNSLVGFEGGPVRSGADGSFETPEKLLIGSTYRLDVRESGKDPISSDWITIREKTRTLAPLVLGALRSVRGRVFDRQGRPVAGAQVFQSGDGPERTKTETDAEGKFALGGFQAGPAFVFVRAGGFRFEGRLIAPGEDEFRVQLTHSNERPAIVPRMLPDAIPLAESRALALRLMEPCWKAAAQSGDDAARFRILFAMVPANPAGVLEKLAPLKFQDEKMRFVVLKRIVVELAALDVEDAAAVAETIADAGTRAWGFLQIADRLPDDDSKRKAAFLERSLQQAKVTADPSERMLGLAEVAERLFERGEIERAKSLFAEGLSIAKELIDQKDFNRALFAARLARVDLPAALQIAKNFAGDEQESRVLGNIAFHIAAENPSEAGRLWTQTARMSRRGLDAEICWKLAGVDPAAALRVLEGMPWIDQKPGVFINLALGAKARNEAAAQRAIEKGVAGLDKILRERPERYTMIAGSLLPAIERIDPALVPEMLWRDVASRPPAVDPRVGRGYSPTGLVAMLAWYDREVAAAVFEPTRKQIEHTDPAELANWRYEFLAWSMFDPRAAAERLEQTPISSDVAGLWRCARVYVGESLGRSHEERWGAIWRERELMYGGKRRDL